MSFFNDLRVDGPEPWLPAAQYFGTKGFFHDYDARPSEPLKVDTGRLWAAGFAKLGQGQLDPNALAREIAMTEAGDGGTPLSAEAFARLLPAAAMAKVTEPQAAVTRGTALQWMWELLP